MTEVAKTDVIKVEICSKSRSLIITIRNEIRKIEKGIS